ncbi:hypothetical protein IQ22_02307 [Pseudomonas duriflava]|uniref:Alpha/beta hydrolase n=1 Tax=Pseudomonas duriflava TaxID=459528 RepID=A0A562QAC8_9PSED|nr:alpha/beta hydrolase [Pseudomonas duriflava]TWI53702.1 hypothetical protein IQ22_02307 [Pseudomonas duriflava]
MIAALPSPRPLLLAVAITGLLTGCLSHPRPKESIGSNALIEQLQATGYQPSQPRSRSMASWSERWTVGEEKVDTEWLVPEGVQKAPLIIYMPGLGEGSEAGQLWREAWVQAGYAVLSIQPARFGRTIYSSREAEAGSFRVLAQRSYSQEALKTRIHVIDQIVTQLRLQARMGEARLAPIDWERLTVAGYDLGAQTAAALAGERDPGQTLPETAIKPVAAILLSPYVQDMANPVRFRTINVPVLTATGPQDEDVFSWVRSAGQRRQLWQGLSVPGSYQLILSDADHRVLSGSLGDQPQHEKSNKRAEEPSDGAGPGGRGPGGGPSGPGKAHGGRGGSFGHGQGEESRFDPRQAAAIRAVSTAFLDATVERSTPAQTWLSQPANAWLGSQQAHLDLKR